MRIVTTLLLGVNVGMFLVFVVSRPALTPDAWAFLERQRPVSDGDGMQMSVVADGLNYALARRALGGWENAFGRFFMLVNIPAYLASAMSFHLLQFTTIGSSKLNSDLATAVFAVVAVAQCLGVATLFSIQALPKGAA